MFFKIRAPTIVSIRITNPTLLLIEKASIIVKIGIKKACELSGIICATAV